MRSIVTPLPNALFLATEADKNTRSSLGQYIAWLDATGANWMTADIKDYRAYLLSEGRGLSQASAKKHMERIRARYKALLHHNGVRDILRDSYMSLPKDDPIRLEYSVWEFTAESLVRLENNTQYDKLTAITLTKITTYTDDKFTWLSREEIEAIFAGIPATKIGMRDAAIFGLCLSFGLREDEACNVTVEDLNKFVKGVAGVEVRHGKGDKQRFVQRDELADFTGYVQAWLEVAGISSGLVLGGLKPRQLQNRVREATKGTVKPHDLRRSYAKLLHDGKRSIEYISQQLGHTKHETTMIYLGMIGR